MKTRREMDLQDQVKEGRSHLQENREHHDKQWQAMRKRAEKAEADAASIGGQMRISEARVAELERKLRAKTPQ